MPNRTFKQEAIVSIQVHRTLYQINTENLKRLVKLFEEHGYTYQANININENGFNVKIGRQSTYKKPLFSTALPKKNKRVSQIARILQNEEGSNIVYLFGNDHENIEIQTLLTFLSSSWRDGNDQTIRGPAFVVWVLTPEEARNQFGSHPSFKIS
jgi:hypothetical protein